MMKSEKSVEPIRKGSIVKYQGGFYRVTAVFEKSGKVNLASIFHSKIYFKGAFLNETKEAYEEWYGYWSQSETYKSM